MKTVVVYQGDPPDGGIPVNHVVSLSPEQQRNYEGQEFWMAAFNGARVGMDWPEWAQKGGGKATEWGIFKQPAGSQPGYGPFTLVSWQGPVRPKFPLYGVLGTESEGVKYDIATTRFYREVPDSMLNMGGGSGPMLPPGPTQGGVPGAQGTATRTIEFSVVDGTGFWVAKTPASSAANREGNPHPGISIINPGEWERIAGAGMGLAEELEDYVARGWKGLSQRILAWQGSDSATATEELSSAMTAAERGDDGAARALTAAGVRNSALDQQRQGRGLDFNLDLGLSL